jgi:hypothetical protein
MGIYRLTPTADLNMTTYFYEMIFFSIRNSKVPGSLSKITEKSFYMCSTPKEEIRKK